MSSKPLSGNPMDEEKQKETQPRIKNCAPNFPFASSFFESYGISSGSKSIIKNDKNLTLKNWGIYLNFCIARLKAHHSFPHVRKYDDKFNVKTDLSIPPMVPFNPEVFEEIYQQINMAFTSNINVYMLLTGSQGCGRTSAVYYAMNKYLEEDMKNHKQKEPETRGIEPLREVTNASNGQLSLDHKPNNLDKHRPGPNNQDTRSAAPQPIVFIEADAMIYNQDTKLNNYILNELENFCNLNNIPEDFSSKKEVANNFSQLISYMRKLRLVLYIKNIDIFTEETRQVYLYSLLDGLNSFAPKVVLIFSTSDVFFMNKLEKRVKSRFSFKNYAFDDFQVETDLMSIIESRLDSKIGNEKHFASDMFRVMNKCLRHDDILSLLHRCRIVGHNISFFINLFKYGFLLMDPKEIHNAWMEGPSKLSLLILAKLRQAHVYLNTEPSHLSVLNSLSRPAKLIVLVLHHLNNLRNNDFSITYDKFCQRIKEVINEKFSSIPTKRSWENYSDFVIKENMVLLKKLNFVFLDRTPISLETVIQLHDCISPTFIFAKTNEYDIYFE